jgi:DNA-binding LacI/PurR family transcriptional regulator
MPSPSSRPRRSPTMQDVANAAGVTQPTVSRILSGSPVQVAFASETRKRVIDAARQMGYRPNPLPKALLGASTNLLGVVAREISGPFLAGAMQAILAEATGWGCDITFGHLQGQASDSAVLRTILDTRHCDSVIVIGDISDQPLWLQDLHESNLSVVCVWMGLPARTDVAMVSVDNRQGVYEVVDHLLALGHTRIAFVGGHLSNAPNSDIQERLVAYRIRLTIRSIRFRPEYVVRCSSTLAEGARAVGTLMALPEPPTAIVAATDVLAIGALYGARERNLEVPTELSIAGFDDLPEAAYTSPPLTTVHQPVREMAAAAVHAAIVDGSGVPFATILTPRLVVRGSTGAAPTVVTGLGRGR